ncbi:hypothetical protein [Desulfosarcina sp.]
MEIISIPYFYKPNLGVVTQFFKVREVILLCAEKNAYREIEGREMLGVV